MVKIPLDTICVRTGLLCPSCQAKVERGVVEEWEVEVMKALLEVEDELGGFDFEYVKSERAHGTLYIRVRGSGRIPLEAERALEAKLRGLGVRRVRIIEEASDPVSIIKAALYPARVLSINRHYLPDGSVYYVALVPKSDREYLPGRIEDARYLLSRVERGAGFNVELVDYDSGKVEEVGMVDREKIRRLLDRLGP